MALQEENNTRATRRALTRQIDALETALGITNGKHGIRRDVLRTRLLRLRWWFLRYPTPATPSVVREGADGREA